jgi:hypothetical protein
MDNIILEKLEKANIVVDEEKQTIEVFLEVDIDGESFESKDPGKRISNPNFRKWREGHIRRYLKAKGYKYGECTEGIKSVASNTVGNNSGYWKYKLHTVKNVKNVEIKKQDIKNENTNTKTKKSRRKKTKTKE